jgi:hypothetical protein
MAKFQDKTGTKWSGWVAFSYVGKKKYLCRHFCGGEQLVDAYRIGREIRCKTCKTPIPKNPKVNEVRFEFEVCEISEALGLSEKEVLLAYRNAMRKLKELCNFEMIEFINEEAL